jgi:hypothetical protein
VPYIECPQCGLRLYTAAAWTTRDECPYCLAPLVPDERDPSAVPVWDGGKLDIRAEKLPDRSEDSR